jgi:stage II sporulation protein AA (anti-sigma F factor antagonist)
MGVSLHVKGKILIAKIDGDIDHHNCEIVRNKIDNAVINKNVSKILLDMSKVSFMDSSGIGLVMGRYKLVNKLSGQVVVVSKDNKVVKILKMSSVDKFVNCFDNETDALKALNGGK